jgi:FMN reductase
VVLVEGAIAPPGRVTRAVACLAELIASARQGVNTDVIDLRRSRVDLCDGRPIAEYSAVTRDIIGRIEEASAVVLASPVYRASYPGVLKNLLDVLPVGSLRDKPVGIVAVGASRDHYLGVDHHLRTVLAWFGAVVAPTSVYLTVADFVNEDISPDGCEQLQLLAESVVVLSERLDGYAFGPPPLASRWSKASRSPAKGA